MSESSFAIPNDYLVPAYCARPDFPFLVSFPRTGSHWLRMMMEAYLGKPSLSRAFFTSEPKDYSCHHIHDLDLSYSPSNVIYLMRNPVDTVYSMMSYDKLPISDTTGVWYWAGKYRAHLQKWLRDENFSTHKTILTYEEMKADMGKAMNRVCFHLHEPLVDLEKLDAAEKLVSKDRVRDLVSDPNVMKIGKDYDESRKKFRELYGAEIVKFFAQFPEVLPRPSHVG